MKKLLGLTMIFAAIAFSSNAQVERAQKTQKEYKSEARGGGMKGLDLTPDQQAKMKEMRESFKTKAEAIKNNTTLTEDQKKAQFEALRAEQKKSMDNILTPEQKTKMQEMSKKRDEKFENWKDKKGDKEDREERKEKMEAKKAEYQKELNLTPDQSQKLQTIHKSTREKMKAIKEDKTLTKEQKKAQMKAVKESSKKERNTILTPEQQKKAQELHKENKEKKGKKGFFKKAQAA